ncbi:MAG: hypothetical protein Q9218_003373, partial [Villophora microphyllina]
FTGDAHLVRMPLQIIDIIKTGMHEKRVQIPCFLAEARYAITALLGGAELDFEDGRIGEASHRLVSDWLTSSTSIFTRNRNRPNIELSPMFGPFKPTSPLSGGLLWKIPWRLSAPQKARQRKRLRAVDSVIACVDAALQKQGSSMKDLERWKAEMPKEEEMRPKDKYTIFDRKEKKYRKGIHKLPKWTRVSQRINPPGF